MSEEIDWLNEELETIQTDVKALLDELTAKKKAPPAEVEEKLNTVEEKMNRAKDIVSNFRIELRSVAKEIGREKYNIYEQKGKEHNVNISKLNQQVESTKNIIAKRELMKGAVKKPIIDETTSGNEIIEEGKKVQQNTANALFRTGKLVDEMEKMGTETNMNLKGQTEQIRQTNSDVESVQGNLKRATKQIRDIGRKLATDKLIMCLVLLLILAIIGVIVGRSLGITPGSSVSSIDCALVFTQTTAECLAARANATVTTTPAPSSSSPTTSSPSSPSPSSPSSVPVANMTTTVLSTTPAPSSSNTSRRLLLVESLAPFTAERWELPTHDFLKPVEVQRQALSNAKIRQTVRKHFEQVEQILAQFEER
ncbi:hypothetical protein GUITHDRAFT_138563 [Guillardia theta CCMP2712]|uniref:t-SNARE coiled-coil homology domain-containing protein n=1 Tax=Guillardia theta (strain CCMP2712) TaxID=905079 RepID=L1JC13_GUITC|nr:hypothetical protein GUITHDRAFT_138563 [Guillardia theta CCMP2712]EKX46088.1 hypothetical protein GUITHDRAFT_138563 [Guillardia theta CCMP2712]|mmetsp:Transcript_10763/g.36146  ORF Transcript_10763/g.36146 Transcript_10763/m.36146 type:complete len:367 (-) Transcript_10763:149-1249(-)|eukprot:XP_005833068.1 hypothetical protein GUITHDRAFT_138563 [Guillardia theta CCMP2712]